MELITRRKFLSGLPNPNPKLDYVSGFEGSIDACGFGQPTAVILRYVPDRLILTEASFEEYLATIEQGPWGSLEEIAAIILDDIRNELVTRWVQVVVKADPTGLPHLQRHAIMLQDYQPNWDNEELLSVLPLI